MCKPSCYNGERGQDSPSAYFWLSLTCTRRNGLILRVTKMDQKEKNPDSPLQETYLSIKWVLRVFGRGNSPPGCGGARNIHPFFRSHHPQPPQQSHRHYRSSGLVLLLQGTVGRDSTWVWILASDLPTQGWQAIETLKAFESSFVKEDKDHICLGWLWRRHKIIP